MGLCTRFARTDRHCPVEDTLLEEPELVVQKLLQLPERITELKSGGSNSMSVVLPHARVALLGKGSHPPPCSRSGQGIDLQTSLFFFHSGHRSEMVASMPLDPLRMHYETRLVLPRIQPGINSVPGTRSAVKSRRSRDPTSALTMTTRQDRPHDAASRGPESHVSLGPLRPDSARPE